MLIHILVVISYMHAAADGISLTKPVTASRTMMSLTTPQNSLT